MPQPGDGEVRCGACRRALNRSDINCYACGSRNLDRSQLQRELSLPDPTLGPVIDQPYSVITDNNCWSLSYLDGKRVCPEHSTDDYVWRLRPEERQYAQGWACELCERKLGPNGWEPR